MANLTVDTTNFGSTSTGSTISFSMTLNASANLICCLVSLGGSSSGGTPTWNGTNMTQIINNVTWGDSCSLWYIQNPATGTHTMSVPVINSGSGGGTASGISFLNANASPIGATVSAQVTSTSVTGSITTTNANSILIEAYRSGVTGGTVGGPSGLTLLVSQSSLGFSGNGYKTAAAVATYSSETWGTNSSSAQQGVVIAEIKGPLVASATAGFLTNFM